MKTVITFLLSLTIILTGVIVIDGQTPDVVLIVASIFAASLAAWTMRQYERKYFPLTAERPLHLPLVTTHRANPPPARRLAA